MSVIEATLTKDLIFVFFYAYFFSRKDLRNERYHFIGFPCCRQLGVQGMRTKRNATTTTVPSNKRKRKSWPEIAVMLFDSN